MLGSGIGVNDASWLYFCPYPGASMTRVLAGCSQYSVATDKLVGEAMGP